MAKTIWHQPNEIPTWNSQVVYMCGKHIHSVCVNFDTPALEKLCDKWCYLQDLISIAEEKEHKDFLQGLYKWLCEAWEEIASGQFYTDGYEIVDEPKGKKQEIDIEESNFDAIPEEYSFLTHQYVNQTTNGGYTGDEFSGDLYFPLPDGKYMKVYYNCC